MSLVRVFLLPAPWRGEMNRISWSVLVTAVLALFAVAGTAQAGIGVRGGVAASGMLSSDHDFRPYLGYEVEVLQRVGFPQFGPQLSMSWDAQLLDFLSVRPEFGFVQRGYHLIQPIGFINPLYKSSYKVRISYLELPVLFRLGLPRGKVRPGLVAGPFAACRLAAAGRLDHRGESEVRSLTTVRAFDFGLVLGADSEIPAGRGRLVFDLRFNWGLADAMHPAAGHIPVAETPGRVQVLSLALMTGYRF
jgi:hypothetical protein